jgi:hypothetical protein
MGAVVLVVASLSGATHEPALFLRVASSVAAGLVTFVGVVILLGRRAASRRGPAVGSRGPLPR